MLAVRFNSNKRTRYFNFEKNNIFKLNDEVLVKVLDREKRAKIIFLDDKIKPNFPILNSKCIRKLSEKEKEIFKKISERKKYARSVFLRKAFKYKLKLKLIDVKYSTGKNLFSFFLKSGIREINLLNFKKDIIRTLKARVELKQIGSRDEARRIGGLGPCGIKLCCSAFLPKLQTVSIKAVKDQHLPLNPARISGVCGKLFCCLNYEENNYRGKAKLTFKVDPALLLKKCTQKDEIKQSSNLPEFY